MGNIELIRKVTLKEKKVTAKPKSKLWLWILFVVVLAIGLIAVFFNKDSNGENLIAQIETTTVIADDNNTENAFGENQDNKNVTSKETVSTLTETSPVKEEKSAESANPTRTIMPADNQKKTLISGSLDEKVKQVIRGNFGNGEERKQALGNEYGTIQEKVNEMYRNGKV